MIIRISNWNRRNPLRKQFGFTSAIVFDWEYGAVACDRRLRIKQYLGNRFGPPVTLDYAKNWINVDSDWLAVRESNNREYTIAVRDRRLRDWLLLL